MPAEPNLGRRGALRRANLAQDAVTVAVANLARRSVEPSVAHQVPR